LEESSGTIINPSYLPLPRLPFAFGFLTSFFLVEREQKGVAKRPFCDSGSVFSFRNAVFFFQLTVNKPGSPITHIIAQLEVGAL
jgi:hypothetical protein